MCIGKRLIAVKEQLPHGEWLSWLREKVELAERTAQRFMKCAEEFRNPPALADFPPSKVFALLELPPMTAKPSFRRAVGTFSNSPTFGNLPPTTSIM
jgi:hypothetical protein